MDGNLFHPAFTGSANLPCSQSGSTPHSGSSSCPTSPRDRLDIQWEFHSKQLLQLPSIHSLCSLSWDSTVFLGPIHSFGPLSFHRQFIVYPPIVIPPTIYRLSPFAMDTCPSLLVQWELALFAVLHISQSGSVGNIDYVLLITQYHSYMSHSHIMFLVCNLSVHPHLERFCLC
ncbi:hypothetical protein B0H11DRAFT_15848 [Mycena galericulata]|nr:hypothetical protein B0H11DRAFT_15848 [Mycena galericulata]